MTLQETRAYDDIINNQVIEQTAKNAETAIAQAEAQGDTDFGA